MKKVTILPSDYWEDKIEFIGRNKIQLKNPKLRRNRTAQLECDKNILFKNIWKELEVMRSNKGTISGIIFYVVKDSKGNILKIYDCMCSPENPYKLGDELFEI